MNAACPSRSSLFVGTSVGRFIAFSFGLFAFLGGVENRWWIDVRPIPETWLAIPGAILIFHALYPATCRPLVAAVVFGLIGVVGFNAATYAGLDLAYRPAVPFSAVVLLPLFAILWMPRLRRPRLAGVVTVSILALGLPLGQIGTFGRTDYARAADVIVVFGARTYRDGRPSLALADRVRTACRLYHEGHADTILMSGGPGDGAVHETEAMRDLALSLGVPARAIRLDRLGLDTRATVENTGPGRILAVSHSWHLPRIKSTYRRAGRAAYTVPAEETRPLPKTPYLVMREVAAFWWYLAT